MNELIKIEIVEGNQVIDSRIIAEGLGIQHKNLLKTIRKYQTELEELGRVAFETLPLETEGGNIAKEARKMLKAKTGKNIVNSLNFLPKNRDKYLKE